MNIAQPELLDDAAFYQSYAEFLYLRKLDREFYISIAKEALSELLPKQDTD